MQASNTAVWMMNSVPFDNLPAEARVACMRLRDALQHCLGTDLLALWVYGASTFSGGPKKLGDIDTHGLLSHAPDIKTAAMIDEIHRTIAVDLGIEWDSWYILRKDAMGVHPPRHAFREHLIDDAWALHRAHWLAGQCVVIAGAAPADFVRPPSWEEIEEDLRKELRYIERFLTEERDDPGHAAYAVWNGCRLVYSMETRDAAVSKRTAALWALDEMPSHWHDSIRAAGRVYDGETCPEDAAILKASVALFVADVKDRLTRL